MDEDTVVANVKLPNANQDDSIIWPLWSTKSIEITPGAYNRLYKKGRRQAGRACYSR